MEVGSSHGEQRMMVPAPFLSLQRLGSNSSAEHAANQNNSLQLGPLIKSKAAARVEEGELCDYC